MLDGYFIHAISRELFSTMIEGYMYFIQSETNAHSATYISCAWKLEVPAGVCVVHVKGLHVDEDHS